MRDEGKLAIDRWENEGGRSLLPKVQNSATDSEIEKAVGDSGGRAPHPFPPQRAPEKSRQIRGHAGRIA